MNASASVTKASVTNPDTNKQTQQQLAPKMLTQENCFRDVANFHVKILVVLMLVVTQIVENSFGGDPNCGE